jgi:hypothetical protein
VAARTGKRRASVFPAFAHGPPNFAAGLLGAPLFLNSLLQDHGFPLLSLFGTEDRHRQWCGDEFGHNGDLEREALEEFFDRGRK